MYRFLLRLMGHGFSLQTELEVEVHSLKASLEEYVAGSNREGVQGAHLNPLGLFLEPPGPLLEPPGPLS